MTLREQQGLFELVPQDAARTEFILYQTADGRTRVQVRLSGDTVWLTQSAIADLYQITPQSITMHISAIYAEGELTRGGNL